MSVFTIYSNRPVAAGIHELTLVGDTAGLAAGKFVDIALDGKFLRRPLSACDVEGNHLVLVYKVVGEGTRQLSHMFSGRTLDVLTPLGNGFDLSVPIRKAALLVGGGVGSAPLRLLARKLREKGIPVFAALGFASDAEVFYEAEFAALCSGAAIATADGSMGVKGTALTAAATFAGVYDYVFACGPEPMLRAVAQTADCGAQLSLEARMACGFGVCMGCSIRTASGPRRVCKDGPVFRKEELLW